MTLQLASVQPLETLIESAETFESTFGMKVIEGYLEFPQALPYSLKQLQAGGMAEPWTTYLFIHSTDNALIGLGGYKGAPDTEGMVEIGYGIAPAYRGRGYASEAAQGMMRFAFEHDAVRQVWAHTLAEPNASARVLTKCGFTRTLELDDPDEGKIWRWEITRESKFEDDVGAFN